MRRLLPASFSNHPETNIPDTVSLYLPSFFPFIFFISFNSYHHHHLFNTLITNAISRFFFKQNFNLFTIKHDNEHNSIWRRWWSWIYFQRRSAKNLTKLSIKKDSCWIIFNIEEMFFFASRYLIPSANLLTFFIT